MSCDVIAALVKKPISAAVVGVGALLGDGIDDARQRGAVLGVELVRHDLEFLDRLERRTGLRAGAAAAQVVVVAAAVELVDDAGAGLAVDRHVVGLSVRRPVVDDARQDGDQAGEVAVAVGQVRDFRSRDVAADLRGREIDLRRFGRTVRFSSTPPTRSVRSTCSVVPMRRTMSSCVSRLKPGSCAVTL